MSVAVEATKAAEIDPATLVTAAEWQHYADLLLADVRAIEAQLGDRTREMEPGYWIWRKKANDARNFHMQAYRQAKTKAAELRQRDWTARRAEHAPSSAVPASSLQDLLDQAFDALKLLAGACRDLQARVETLEAEQEVE
jgi:hypothetical protein